jgi:hypothetical protein
MQDLEAALAQAHAHAQASIHSLKHTYKQTKQRLRQCEEALTHTTAQLSTTTAALHKVCFIMIG